MLFKKNQQEIMLGLAASMQTNRSMMFDKDGADNGKPKWAPLVLRQGRPLQKTGTLRKSMAPMTINGKPGKSAGTVLLIEGNRVTIGTTLLYAGMMNDGTAKMPGGVLRPKQAQALKIPIEGGKFMFRKSVKIPARRMNEITELDKAEFSETMANHIASILNTGERSG